MIDNLTSCNASSESRGGREREQKSPFLFASERGSPFTTAGFARMIEQAGKVAKLSFKPHPHMLRHACGTPLANRATIRGRWRHILATATSSIRCAIPNCRRRGSKISGVSERHARLSVKWKRRKITSDEIAAAVASRVI